MMTDADIVRRQRWMAALAKARPEEIEAVWAGLPRQPAYRLLRPVETGMVMVRGRAGGTGRRFNIGEMTVTRGAVQIESGTNGYSYVAGRSQRQAELAAVLDAVLQDAPAGDDLESAVVAPLTAAQEERRRIAAGKTAATKVDFFTVVRGED